jgi:hypothetical protein
MEPVKIKHKLIENKECVGNIVKNKINSPPDEYEFVQYKKLLEAIS